MCCSVSHKIHSQQKLQLDYGKSCIRIPLFHSNSVIEKIAICKEVGLQTMIRLPGGDFRTVLKSWGSPQVCLHVVNVKGQRSFSACGVWRWWHQCGDFFWSHPHNWTPKRCQLSKLKCHAWETVTPCFSLLPALVTISLHWILWLPHRSIIYSSFHDWVISVSTLYARFILVVAHARISYLAFTLQLLSSPCISVNDIQRIMLSAKGLINNVAKLFCLCRIMNVYEHK